MIFEVYTDGTQLGDVKVGGWASIIKRSTSKRDVVIRGADIDTTSNRMELIAVIESIEYIKKSYSDIDKITIYSDSRYVVNGVTEWLPKWIENGWRKADNKELLNRDLWVKYCVISHNINIEYNWIKAHNGHTENTKVDKLASKEAKNYLKKLKDLKLF